MKKKRGFCGGAEREAEEPLTLEAKKKRKNTAMIPEQEKCKWTKKIWRKKKRKNEQNGLATLVKEISLSSKNPAFIFSSPGNFHSVCSLNCIDLTPNSQPLSWHTRMKIAVGAAKGIEYLHEVANPPVIYRDLKASNILLDGSFNAKLSDFGLAKLGPSGDKTHVSTRVMGTYGYCAPEYAMTGKLTKTSDIYSFGVVLLELITGRRAIDTTKPTREQILVHWVSFTPSFTFH